MSNQIAVLGTVSNPDVNPSFTVTGVFWLAVPANNVVPVPKFQSQVPWVDQVTLGQLRAGVLIEQPFASQPFILSNSLSGTASVTNGSTAVTFTVAQTISPGTTLFFSGQSSTGYTLSSLAIGGLSGTLQTPYTGSTGSGETMVTGAATAPTAAAVQTALLTQFATAQTALTNAASPLAGVVGTEYTGSAWVSVASGLVVFDPLGKLTTSIDWAASAGLIPGVTVGRATGYCSTSAASNTPIMATSYTPQSSNGQRSFVSSSANDTAAGTGAQQVTVNYLDSSFVLHQEVITLNGTTPVNTVGTNYCFFDNWFVSRVGSGGVNAGTISSYTAVNGGGSVWGSMTADGSNQTSWCHHYVPAGVTCYLRSMMGASFSVAGTVFLMHTGNPLGSNLPLQQFGPTLMHPGGDSREHPFVAAPSIVGPDRIILYVRPQASTADSTLGNFEWVQF